VNRSELQNLRQQLLKMRFALEQIESESKGSGATVELDQTKVGRLSRMDAMQSQQMALASERRRALQLQNISEPIENL
jgi:DnaK suppressor protein